MSDTIFDFGTSYDTVVAPAGDAATMSAIDQPALDMTPPDATGAEATGATSGNDAANLADAGTPLDVANAEPPAVAAQPGDQTDTGVDPSEKAPMPAPVTDQSTQAQQAPVTDLSTNASSKGIIDSVAQATKDNPAAANIVGKMLAGGATGAMTALALRNKLQAEREAEERHRQDVIRRGQVPAFAPGTFTPKPGLIDSRSA